AVVALLAGLATTGLGCFVFVDEFPLGLIALACVAGALGAAWFGLLHHGVPRWTAAALALALSASAIVAVASGENHGLLPLIVVVFAVGAYGARRAFKPNRRLPPAPPPRHPVLFVNPRSGDGCAERVGLVAAARERGLETVVLG